MEYSFCSICGNSYREDSIPSDLKEYGAFSTLHRLDFTLINGNIVCINCWRESKFSRE